MLFHGGYTLRVDSHVGAGELHGVDHWVYSKYFIYKLFYIFNFLTLARREVCGFSSRERAELWDER
jgi:hypothetical protein